jgi:hypothetical protein
VDDLVANGACDGSQEGMPVAACSSAVATVSDGADLVRTADWTETPQVHGLARFQLAPRQLESERWETTRGFESLRFRW